MSDYELEQCPWCETKDGLVFFKNTNGFHVVCDLCHLMSTEAKYLKIDAANAWNKFVKQQDNHLNKRTVHSIIDNTIEAEAS